MSRFLTVRWRLAGAFFLVVLIVLAMTGLYLLDWTERHYLRTVREDLQHESRAVARIIQATPGNTSDLIVGIGHDVGRRITVIRSDGSVVADSRHDAGDMPDHSDRPEFRQAMATGYGTSTRYSTTLRTRMLYVATPYGPPSKRLGVVRVARPLSGLDRITRTMQQTFLLAGLIAVLAAAALSFRLASSITGPIESIASAARRLEQGDLGARVNAQPKPGGELGALTSAFDSMAGQLQENLDEMSRQKARLQAVFDHSDNGLLLVDQQNRVRMINPAACHLFGIESGHTLDKTLIEGTLHHDLAALVERVRQTQEPAALDLHLPAKERRAVHAYVAPLARPDGSVDVLIVLNDVTQMRRLDAVRRDFVANVSHELHTPLATIKAMAETIMLRHSSDPAAVPGFAESIVQETDRMTLLAGDLLDLTRAESQGHDLAAERLSLRAVVLDVFERLKTAAEKKSISMTCDVPEDEIIETNAGSLDQVLANLIDNSIKYTPDGGSVKVSSERRPGRVTIRVSDNGIGIPSDDQPRIFERFYRVDKDRSRQSGGTGLGLAIVKHLCENIGASVSVESEPGKGSTFSVLLPVGESAEAEEPPAPPSNP